MKYISSGEHEKVIKSCVNCLFSTMMEASL